MPPREAKVIARGAGDDRVTRARYCIPFGKEKKNDNDNE